MILKKIREIAEQKNIMTDKLKKSELVRAIQVPVLPLLNTCARVPVCELISYYYANNLWRFL